MKSILICLCMLLPFQATANSPFIRVQIREIVIHDSNQVLIYFDEEVNQNEGCVNKNRIVLLPSRELFKEMYSTLLSAFYSGTEIHGWVNGCHADRKSPILTRIDLEKI